ncbi:MAG: hypothetical protein LBD59_09435 [Prevotellaceae bacterium]|jgi:hypothetical protein|nr:hypothetical protein [Prevotellaceae bacterium]
MKYDVIDIVKPANNKINLFEKICRTAQIAGFFGILKSVRPNSANRMKKNVQKNALFLQILWNIAEKYAILTVLKMLNNVNGVKNFLVKIQAVSQFLTSYNSHVFDLRRLQFVNKSEMFLSINYCSKSNYEAAKNSKIPEQRIRYQQKTSN